MFLKDCSLQLTYILKELISWWVKTSFHFQTLVSSKSMKSDHMRLQKGNYGFVCALSRVRFALLTASKYLKIILMTFLAFILILPFWTTLNPQSSSPFSYWAKNGLYFDISYVQIDLPYAREKTDLLNRPTSEKWIIELNPSCPIKVFINEIFQSKIWVSGTWIFFDQIYDVAHYSYSILGSFLGHSLIGMYLVLFGLGPPAVMGYHDTMLLHINTVLILMASFYRVCKIVPLGMIQVRRDSAQKYDPKQREEDRFFPSFTKVFSRKSHHILISSRHRTIAK